MNHIHISVIVPTFKPDLYLKDCIDSLKKQDFDYSGYEVIIILNGPKDPFWDKICEWIGDDERFVLLYSKLPGVSRARNMGLDVARGEYVTFMDDDDMVSSSYLAGMYAISDRRIVVVSMVRSFHENMNQWAENFFICRKMRQIEKYRNASLFRNRSFISYVAGKLLHRKAIGNIRFDTRFTNGEDSLFMTSITRNIETIRFTDYSACYYVRERQGSASRKRISRTKLLQDSIRLIKQYILVYMSSPLSYSMTLFLSRIPGVLKNSYILSKNK